jgi:CO dehydrogenase nickel-insertion accessory protein CooC1
MDIHIEHTWLILNRLPGEMPAPLQERVAAMDIPLLGVVPADARLVEFEFSGRPLVDLGDDSPVFKAISTMMQRLDL